MGRVEPFTWLGNVSLSLQPDPAEHRDPWWHEVVWCGGGVGWGGGGLQIHPDEFGLKNKVSQGASGGGALSKQKLLSLPVSPQSPKIQGA